MPDLFQTDRYEGLERSAAVSEDGLYRWWLRRAWRYGGNGKVVAFIMLNPSTADALVDDPTIRRCMAFTQAWGYSVLSVRNLFAWRCTDPKDLPESPKERNGGTRGDAELLAGLTADLVVCAWGAHPVGARAEWFLAQRRQKQLFCLGTTKGGQPRHPLYVKSNQVLLPYPDLQRPTP